MLKKIIYSLVFTLCTGLVYSQTDTVSQTQAVAPPDTILPVKTDTIKTQPAVNATLKIWIKGFHSLKGSVFVGLYNRPQGFATENSYRSFSYEITGAEMWVAFDSLPKGSYAAAIIHDENNNRKLDQGEMGIPIEGYGFSNDARGMFGPPDFRLAMFYFNGTSNKTIIINLLYPKKLK